MVTSFQTFNSRHINNNGHDDDSVTTWGRHELEDNRQERHRTNNNSTTPANHHNASTTNTKQSTPQKHEFLSPSSSNSSPSSTVGTLKQQETPSQKGVTFSALSPMTNTLNVLSQNMDDLRYDAAVSMLQLDHGETTTNNNDGNDGGNDKVASKNDKVASKKTTLTDTRKHDNDSPFDKEERMKSKAIRQPQSAKSPKSASSESTNPDRFKKIPLNKDKESKTASATTKSTSPAAAFTNKQPVKASRTSSTTTTAVRKQPDNDSDSYIVWKHHQQDYIRKNICIVFEDSDDQPLGMRIQKDHFGSLVHDRHCRVLKTFGLATEHGVQTGDWIAWPMSQEDEHVRLASMEQVKEWTKERPIVSFCILRKKEQRQKDELAPKGTKEESKKKPRTTAWIDRDGFGGNEELPSKENKCSKRTPPPPSKDKHPMVTPQSGKATKSSTNQSSSSNSGRDRWSGNDDQKQRLTNSTSDKNTLKSLDDVKKNSSTAPRKEITERSRSSNIAKDREKTKKSAVAPYCLKCNTPDGPKAPKMHHAWCPHNEFFERSGAKEIFQRMQNGLRIGCTACELEHQLGKIQKRRHIDSCIEFDKKLKEDAKDDSDSEVSTPILPPKPIKKRPAVASYHSLSSSSDDSDDDPDDVSCYRPLKKKQKIQTIALAPLSPKPRSKDKSEEDDEKRKAKKHSRKQKSDSKVEQHSSKAASKSQPKKRKKKPQATSNTKCQKKQTAYSVSSPDPRSKPNSDETLSQDENEGSESQPRLKDPPKYSESSEGSRKQQLKLRWVVCEDDPWGPAGYADGDVLLYGPQEGIPNQSFMIPSERFALEPFSAESSYRNTHCTPEEGCSMLLLRREPMGRRPWGMKVIWDEFGHACLIDSVDPLSPAAAATYVGCSENRTLTTDSGLRVNDMLLSVNGKLVGGMTEIQLEVELETCGPNLLLVVSRYKHANHVKQKFLEVERRILHVMDSAARDDRLIGWKEIGNGAVNSLGASLYKVSNGSDRNSNIDEVPEAGGARGVLRPNLEGAELQHSPRKDLENQSNTSLSGEENRHPTSESTVGAEGKSPLKTAREEIGNSESGSFAADFENKGQDDEKSASGCSFRGKTKTQSHLGSEDPQHHEITTVVVDLGNNMKEDHESATDSTAVVEKEASETANDNISTLSKEDGAQSFSPGGKSTDEDSIASEGHSGKDSKTSFGSHGEDSDWENDPNAWNGCVCGATHGESDEEVFWIQCDSCDTWYCVAAKCVGFSEKEADGVKRWSCSACPSSSVSQVDEGNTTTQPDSEEFTESNDRFDAAKDFNKRQHSPHGRQRSSKRASSSKGRKPRAPKPRRSIYAPDRSLCPETPATDSIPTEMIGKEKKDVYHIDDYVYVKSHSWAGKNCEGGIGKILEGPYENSSGVPCYTVRFIVGSTEKNVEIEYIFTYSFETTKRRKRGT